MTKERLDGLLLLSLGSVLFVLAGAGIAHLNFLGLIDFKEFYCGSRCLIEHRDPYKQADLAAIYQQIGDRPSTPGEANWLRATAHVTPNFPTTFLLVAPLAVLQWKLAGAIWMALSAGAFVLGCFLIWDAGVEFAPQLAGGMIFLFLVNSEMLLALGNTAGLVIGLTLIGAWCFLKDRFVLVGAICMALALAFKPHDAGLVWLYCLLACGMLRKRALQTLAIAAVLVVSAAVWVSRVAPDWIHELHSNQVAIMARGGLDDPGPSSGGAYGVNAIVSLQTIVSRFWDNPNFYNPVVYAICAALLLVGLGKMLRTPYSTRQAWFALAAIAPLSMLALYHRCYDARLLLLTVPACAALWKERGGLAWAALLLNLAAVVLTGDVFWIAFFQLTHYSGPALAFGAIPPPLILLAVSVFYLWVFVRQTPEASAA
ncbi:MAG: hypothetical protein ACLQG3_11865 [Terracidiphilus sp.]